MSKLICSEVLMGICLTPADQTQTGSLFGFAEYLTALALLTIVYSLSDRLYRFRLSTAPISLFRWTFGAIISLGLITLATELWFAEGWLAPALGLSKAVIEGAVGFLVLSLAGLWIWWAFISPAKFGARSCERFIREVYQSLMRGTDSDLAVVSSEIGRSAEQIVACLAEAFPRQNRGDASPGTKVAAIAHDLILLISAPRLCRYIVTSSPLTAIALLTEVANQKRFGAPLGIFTRNLTTSALQDRNAVVWQEDSWYESGLLGHLRPFSKAVYGDWSLVEHFSQTAGPLDLEWRFAATIDAEQLGAYSRAVLMTLKAYAAKAGLWQHSNALTRAIGNFGDRTHDVYKLDGKDDHYPSDELRRFRVACEFAKEATDVFKGLGKDDVGVLRDKANRSSTLLDQLAELMLTLVLNASAVRSPVDTAWSVHYLSGWSKLFVFAEDSPARRVVYHKFRRLVYDELKDLEKLANYKGAGLLGICLNIFGLRESGVPRTARDRGYWALRVVVLAWAKRHYLRLVEVHPRVAEACLIGGISFDAENNRLVKTYAPGLALQPQQEFLELAPASDSCLGRLASA